MYDVRTKGGLSEVMWRQRRWRVTYAAGQEKSWPEDILGFEEGDLGEHEEDEGKHPCWSINHNLKAFSSIARSIMGGNVQKMDSHRGVTSNTFFG